MINTQDDDRPSDIRMVCAQFDPVAHRFGLRGPVVTDRNLEFEVDYFGPRLGLEVQIARGDMFPYLMVFRHDGDEAPAEYKTPTGRVVKMSSLEVARLLGKSEQYHVRLREIARRFENMPAMLEMAQRIIEDLWPSVKLEGDRLFDRA